MRTISSAGRALAIASLALGTALLLSTPAAVAAQKAVPPRVLVFSKTAGFRHSSIEPGIAAIQKLGKEQGFAVDATEDATAFKDANLKRYRAIVFLSTTGDVLNDTQQGALERYIQAGGGWVGIHSATDTEYDWPWYGRLAGAWFNGHPGDPNVRRGTFRVIDANDPSTTGLPAKWERDDEFYNFKSIDPTIHVLVDIDESTYGGGTNGANHPMSWYHAVDGGRAWYTNMGHTDATFTEPLFLKHLTGGLRYAMGTGALDYTRARPEENRFTRVVLAEKLDEPIELAVLPDERVVFIERHGNIQMYSPKTKRLKLLGTIPVNLTYIGGAQAEDGLLGLAADPHFAKNGWLYMYYSPAGGDPKNVLARFTMRGDSLDLSSAKVMLEVQTQRDQCCHTGGSIAFDAKGNLYLSTGDNTNPFGTGYAPIDERPNRSPWDAQKSSANTNDLRGKVIRIHPEADGTYTIPEGNLFKPGTPKTRPEIYTMGHRNPYRISVDQRNGAMYWGDVGPDAGVDSVGRGPAGQDEIGRAAKAGNYGWPHFVGDNKAYAHVDFATMQAGPLFDADHPMNTSPNNTGLVELPPAQKAFIWYPYGPSKEFPLVGSGGRASMAGPVFHRDEFTRAARPFPSYYDNKLLIFEWMRDWIMSVTMDADGNYVSMERFLPTTKFVKPSDMAFGPNGDLYMLEYGSSWFRQNDDASLVRVEYNAGNRPPTVVASADRTSGAAPLRVVLSSRGTTDPEDDQIRYEWELKRINGTLVRRVAGPEPTITLDDPGIYTATLTATDSHGARAVSRVLRLSAGNESPHVGLDIASGNKTFFFRGAPIKYAAHVTDREDGSLGDGTIDAQRVQVSAEFLKDGTRALAAARSGASAPARFAEGRALIEASDCLACHKFDAASVGPAYTVVAERYRTDTTARVTLQKKIRVGGSGVWGTVAMAAHPQLTESETEKIVNYILSLSTRSTDPKPMAVAGEYMAPDSAFGAVNGAIVLRASYTDRGANGILGVTAETTVVLRSPRLVVADGVLSDGVAKMSLPQSPVPITLVTRSGGSSRIARVDLTAVSAITFAVAVPKSNGAVGGTIEVHLDSEAGALLGESAAVEPQADQRTVPVRVSLKPTAGTHDVVFVIRNKDAQGGQLLMAALTATFESTLSAP